MWHFGVYKPGCKFYGPESRIKNDLNKTEI